MFAWKEKCAASAIESVPFNGLQIGNVGYNMSCTHYDPRKLSFLNGFFVNIKLIFFNELFI